MKGLPFAAVFAVAVCAMAVGPVAADLAVNGGFEGGFTGWQWDPTSNVQLVDSTFEPGFDVVHSGVYAAAFGSTMGTDNTIVQDLATIPGQSYTINVWVSHDKTDTSNFFLGDWNGTEIFPEFVNAPFFHYREFTITEVATSTTGELRFQGAEDLGYFFLDDVSVTTISGQTPEPTSVVAWLLTGLCAGALGLRRKRASA